MASNPDEVLKLLKQLDQKLDSLGAERRDAELTPARGFPVPRQPQRTAEEMLVALSERLEQFAVQSEERARRQEAALERIEKLLAAKAGSKSLP